jgi:hypothetical protein
MISTHGLKVVSLLALLGLAAALSPAWGRGSRGGPVQTWHSIARDRQAIDGGDSAYGYAARHHRAQHYRASRPE